MIFKRISDGKVVFFHLVITFNEKATLIYDAKAEVKMKKHIYSSVMRVGSDTFGDPVFKRAYKLSHPP